ncbi:acyl-CoA dehydrogenase family protein [Sporichthya sp.]|uniref:acyl-CoA dehydrogenase family protein n=1 Tax=Sporichthya sp. TaxID=65475 RepID=UPI0017DA2BCD|nr:acyl-CoA dehydrogenase family protein [Sporichthya sp.]MBA3744117.1 acyl-CoA dehydrogenase family protein [Sporichthya sp.]
MEADELSTVLKEVRRFVRQEVVPLEESIDENDEIPAGVVEAAKRMGLFGFAIPSQYGGLGLSMHEEAQLVMELGWTTPAFRSLFGTNNGIAGHTLLEGGTEQQRETYLPKLASGEWIASFGLTEPEAGSDPGSLTTRAERDGDHWVVNGVKRYITNAPVAEVIMVFARTSPTGPPSRSVSVFLVPRLAPGVSIGPKDRKMGQAGAWCGDVILEDVRVPHEAMIGGEEGAGYVTAMRALAHGRLHIAALCVGMAERLVHESLSYALARQQGGTPIAEFQLVQAMLADSKTDTMAARALVLDAARRFDDGVDVRLGPAASKYFASEAVGRVADRAVQIHGGAGYMRGIAVERLYRDARLFRIYEGTSQIQQLVIAGQMIRAARS